MSESKIRLKCDVCGGTFKDQYTKIICSYCERKEIQLNEGEKQKLIAEFLQDLEEVKGWAKNEISHDSETNIRLERKEKKWQERGESG